MVAIALVLLLLLPAGICEAQVRIAGLAGAGSAIVDGADAATTNPARLTVPEGPRIRLFDSFGGLSNSSYTLSDYRRYNGAELSEKDEDELLGKIDGSELTAEGSFAFSGPIFRHRSWAIGTRMRGAAGANLPKELIRLAFDGNTPDETFRFDGADGRVDLFGEVHLSHAREVTIGTTGNWSFGGTVKLLRGFFYSHIEEAEGMIRTEFDGIEGSGSVRARTASGGTGVGLDLGVWRAVGERWTIALTTQDLFSSIRWTRETEETTANYIVVESTLQDMEGEDDLILTEDVTRPIDSFRTSIPTVMTAGAAREMSGWRLMADWTQGFEESSWATTTPRIAVAAEASPRSWVTGRLGASIGGLDRRSLALGLSLQPGPVQIDLALSARDGYLPFTGRGIAFGLAVGLYF